MFKGLEIEVYYEGDSILIFNRRLRIGKGIERREDRAFREL